MEPVTIDPKTLLDIINGLGTLGVLVVLVVWFMRGDILSRKVYESLILSIVEQTVKKVLTAFNLDQD